MSEVAEQPISHRYAGLRPWTSETASLAGQRSGQVRRERSGLQPVAPMTKPERTQVEAAIQAQLRLVAEQITRTRAVLNNDRLDWCEHCERGGMPPHHQAQLLKALDTLLDRQRKLLGIPDPGPIKHQQPKADRANWHVAQPTAPVPEVQPRPLGWEYDG